MTASPNPGKDPADWVTGDEPMTGPQASYLHTLAQEAGETVDDSLIKADASREIDRLQAAMGRGSAASVDPDPIDVAAATIDARADDAPEQIEELIDHGRAFGRDAHEPGSTAAADLRCAEEVDALTEAGGRVVGTDSGNPLVEGPNSA